MTHDPKLAFLVDGEDPRVLRFVPAEPVSAQTLTAEQVEHYNREGFISPIPVFDADEAAVRRAYIDGLLDDVIQAHDRRNSYSINAYHLVCEGLYDIVMEPRLHALVRDIIGPDVICWGTQVFAKLAGDTKEVPVHQDAIYWPFTPTKSVTVWLALDDVDAGNAAMEFVPGSHRLGPQEHRSLALDGTRVLDRTVVDQDRFTDRYVNAMPAGSISLHNDLLLHGSPPNHSDRRRAALTLRYTAAGVGVVPGYEQWQISAVHCCGDIGERWPHWRRPPGEHPEKMSSFTGGFDGNPPDAG